MERTFTNATLLSASVLTAFMIMAPISHLSAQNEIKLLDEKAKVHKAVIEKIDSSGSLAVTIDDNDVPVYTDASTTVFLGNGDQASLSDVKPKQNVYIFGAYDKDSHSIAATKIVIRNKPILDRSNLTSVTPVIPPHQPDDTQKTLSMLGLTQQ